MQSLALRLLMGLLCVTASAPAAEVWVRPGAAGDGSQGDPVGDLEQAIQAAAAGDTIWLMSGEYGALSISGVHHSPQLTIAGAAGEQPHFSHVGVNDSSGLALSRLRVSGEAAGTLMEISGSQLLVEQCVVWSADDTSGWTAEDWIDRASSGMQVGGQEITIRDNTLRNVGYGISVGASDSVIEGNLVENFSRDGLRGLGDRTVFQYNTVKNCYAVDDHHDDGFQSWSVGDDGVGTGEVVGVVLRGNTFINYEDDEQPHRGTLQGIGCFDGTFVDWLVENNVVITDHWHGITLLGARDSTIRNNTVIDVNEEGPGPPWISIDSHKDGTAPSGCRVDNNLTTDLSNHSSVLERGNIVLEMSQLDQYFVDAARYDLHLRPAAPAVDAGEGDGPELDRDGVARPEGKAFDVGAYEWHDAGMPSSAGAAGSWGTSEGGQAGFGSGGSTANGRGGASPSAAGGSSSAGSGQPSENTDSKGACGCRLHGRAPGSWLAVLGVLIGWLWRVRRGANEGRGGSGFWASAR